MMELGELPAGWTAVTLEAVAEVHDNLREPVNSTERKSRVGPFPYYGATGQVGWIDDFRQDGEYVLLGEDGAPFFDPTKDKAYLVSGKCWVNNHAHVLKGREGVCLNRYLLYALNQVNYRGFANGTTRLKLTQAAMRQLPINLAPLAEQHRIVAKIEELFSELDQGVASLKTAREQLNVYRQSLLKNAFEGKLTAAWRAAHADQLETAAALQQRIARERQTRYQQQLADWQTAGQPGPKPKPPKPLPPLTPEELADLPELPVGWGWARLEALVSGVDQGWSPKCNGRRVDENEWAVIKTTAIQHGRFDELENKALPPELAPRTQHELQPGDILVTRAGPRVRVGVCCLVRSVKPKLMNCDKAYRVRALSSLSSPEFLEAVLNSPRVLDVLERIKSGINDSGVNLNQGAFLELAVPFCGLREQQAVVQELESKLSEADQLDQTLATALQQADALRQSILKKAFHGQLEKQDKNEEPASALLERIRAEKSNGMNTPRNRRKPG